MTPLASHCGPEPTSLWPEELCVVPSHSRWPGKGLKGPIEKGRLELDQSNPNAMISPEKRNPVVADPRKFSPKRRSWKRVLKLTLGVILLVLFALVLFIGSFIFRHQLIVRARPGNLQAHAQPLELGRRVNPFIGTGGFPRVCGNNFPGAMVPFGRSCKKEASL